MYFPSNITTIPQLQDYIRPLCDNLPRRRETYPVPWNCREVIHCSYFGVPLWTVGCNVADDNAYSFTADECVPHHQSDCPFYPLNIL
ncbi:hypothetical protein QKQ66_gp071 [Dione juno nucleopolyhedrovirus]|uniref:Uncharacterized protein n=1 Tax=Dione juno nucleopolyhedrovirus TaxID=2594175 RepID=A0AAE6LC56_9ABAC|nr:hypothetical protein QKQ66_gp071 [Dione juno nucleopolyhedrovirus]QDL56965.1 hypothetical protein DijuNPV-ORF-71 [Dione juno nucleopolyhedrovirus]